MKTMSHTNPDGSTVSVCLGRYVSLGNYVSLGKNVSLGNEVSLGNGVVLGNYVSLERVFDAGCDHRGYRFIAGVDLGRHELRIFAGCRDFSVEDALRHWTIKDNREALRKVDYLVAEAVAKRMIAPRQ